MKSRISVIVPIYNSVRYLRKCVESILRQTYTELELILVDDGSTDHSREQCQHYAEIDKRVVVLNQKNQGASAARNAGLKHAAGEYILFVDSDDWIEENLIETMVMKSQKYCADVVVFGWECEGNRCVRNQVVEKDILLSGREVVEKIINDDYIYGGGYTFNKFWKRNILEKTQVYFDDSLFAYEDKVFAITNYLETDRIAIVTDVLYHYLVHEGSLSRPHSTDQHWKARENVLLAHRKMAEICSVDTQLGRKAYIKYYSVAMKLLASAVKQMNREYINKSYFALKGHYKDILQYEGWTIFRKMKYGLIFAGVKIYCCMSKLEVEL